MRHGTCKNWALGLGLCFGMAGAWADTGISGKGTWQTTLQPRDINADGVVDAYYDTTLNVTWLAEGLNAAPTSERGWAPAFYPTNWGLITWSQATTWVAELDVYGVTGWRLPRVLDADPPGCNTPFATTFSGGDCGYGVLTISPDGLTVYSELAHMYYVTLGNAAWYDVSGVAANSQAFYDSKNSGPFQVLMNPATMWIDGGDPSSTTQWYFINIWGGQNYPIGTNVDAEMGMLAVYDGDVANAIPAIPEPQTYLLVGIGLAAVGVRMRSRRAA